MNVEQQTNPGPGANGALSAATLEDLVRELKTRCMACFVVMVVENDEGDDDLTIVRTLGSRMMLMGACEDVKHKLLTGEGEVNE